MAALTWRNVDAPSFYTSLEGNRMAADMLTKAVGSIQSGLTGFDNAANQQVNRQAMADALKFQDPATLQAALQDGSFLAGRDTSRLTTDTLAAVASRVNDLTSQNKTLSDFTRQQDGYARLDRAGPSVQDYLIAAASGNQLGQQAALANPALRDLRPDQFEALIRNGGSAANTAIGNNQATWNLNQGVRNDTEARAATEAYMSLAPQVGSAGNLNNVLSSDQFKALPAPIRAQVQGMLEKTWGPAYGPKTGADGMAGGAGMVGVTAANAPVGLGVGMLTNQAGTAPGAVGFGTQAGSPYDAQYGYGKYGTPDKAPSQMTLGEAEAYGNKLIAATKGKIGAKDDQGNDLGTSALGAFQIVNGTRARYAEQLFGKDWKSKQFTPEVQDKLGEAIFNDSKRGDLTKIWTSLKNVPGADKAGAFAGQSWDQVKGVIAQGESGATGRATPAQALQSQIASMAQLNQDANDTLSSLSQRDATANSAGIAAVRAAATDNKSDEAVAAELAKKYPGVDKAMLQGEVSRIKRLNPSIRPAQVMAILDNGGLQTSDGAGFLGLRAAVDWMTGENRWGNYRPNSAAIDDLLAKAVGPEADKQASSNYRLQTAGATLQAYAKTANDAYNEVLRLQKAAATNPELNNSAIPNAMAALFAAQQQMIAARRAITSDPSMQRELTSTEQSAREQAVANTRRAATPVKASPNDGPPAVVVPQSKEAIAAAVAQQAAAAEQRRRQFGMNRTLWF